MPWIPAAIGGAGAIGSAIIGQGEASGDREAAQRAYQDSVNQYKSIGVPSVDSQAINLSQYQNAGNLDPSLMQGVKLGDSGMLGISTDPTYKQAQLQALSQLQDIGNNGGMNLTDQSNLENTMNNIRAQEQGSRGAILQHAQQQGGYGNGMALAAQLANSQNAATNEHAAGVQTAANAQQRALQAIMAGGQLGGQMQATSFGQQAQQQQAQDAIAKWNAANQQSTNQYNTGLGNYAQQYNLGNQQNLLNANTQQSNQQQMYNKGLQQQQFNNQLSLASGAANARAGQANNLTTQGNQLANNWANVGSGLAKAGAGASQYWNSQPASTEEKEPKPGPGYQTNASYNAPATNEANDKVYT